MQVNAHPTLERTSLAVMPWTLHAWPPLLWQAGGPTPVRFRHLGTRVMSVGDDRRIVGQTVWGGSAAEGSAGVAWDWIEIADGVVAMADPMAVITNLRIIGDEGEVLTAVEAARYLNSLVHTLPWQHEVGRALQTCH